MNELDLSWFGKAHCFGLDTNIFFPTGNTPGRLPKNRDPINDPRTKAELEDWVIRNYCAECVVRSECLEYAVATAQTYGVWGGTRESERQKLINERGTNRYSEKVGQY